MKLKIGVGDVGTGTGAGDVTAMQDVGDVAMTIGVSQMGMGARASIRSR